MPWIHGKLHGQKQCYRPPPVWTWDLRHRGWTRQKSIPDWLVFWEQTFVANTWFQKPHGKQVTYHAPGVQTQSGTRPNSRNSLCHRWRNACMNVYSQPRANLGSDHFPLHVQDPADPSIAWGVRAAATQHHVTALNKTIEERLLTRLPKSDSRNAAKHSEAIDTNIPTRHHKPLGSNLILLHLSRLR